MADRPVAGRDGAALFYGDAIITPALSVLSAIEGMKTVPGLESMSEPVILGLSLTILIGLFALQARGTASVAGLFGPVCALWFIAIGALGLWHIFEAPDVLSAFNPMWAVRFMMGHGIAGLFVLGAVFLTVTGAEALIADMGHFGRRPIQLGWLTFVWPALTLNYLGQGAGPDRSGQGAGRWTVVAECRLVLSDGARFLRAPLVVLATMATIIASQAVITGAYSLTQQAIALGLMPRLVIRQTSAAQIGQIYMPGVNWMLLLGVICLVFAFRSSSAMAAAYGIAVTGTMVVTTCLAFIIAWKFWGWNPLGSALLIAPFLALDLFFFGANILRVAEGGWVPLLVAGIIGLIIYTAARAQRALQRASEQGVALDELVKALAARSPMIVEGTAVFLTQDASVAPSALLHNLKHNKALHRTNIMLTVEMQSTPYVQPENRLCLERLDERFLRAKLRYGYMDKIDVPSDLAREKGLLTGTGGTSFFVGRSAIRFGSRPCMPRIMVLLYQFLHRNASDPRPFSPSPQPSGRIGHTDRALIAIGCRHVARSDLLCGPFAGHRAGDMDHQRDA
jgi:KUP system potassium uptake protein